MEPEERFLMSKLPSTTEDARAKSIGEDEDSVPGTNRKCCCLKCFAATIGIVLTTLVVYIIVLAIRYSLMSTEDVDFTTSPWPVKDDAGYYQSYKKDDRWQNWWLRDYPAIDVIAWSFLVDKDESGIIWDSTIDEYLPVKRPYWMRDPERSAGDPGVRATWLGHAGVLAEVDGTIVLCDPVFSERCSPSQGYGPKRFTKSPCTVEELPDIIHAVVISHMHYDHLDSGTIKQLHERYGADIQFYVPMDAGPWMKSFGIDDENIHEMVWWQEIELQTNGQTEMPSKIIFTPSNHDSYRGIFDYNKYLWGSWTVIGGGGSKFWFAGDTAYSDVFKQIGQRYGPFDLAAIPIGAYKPRDTMRYVHVNTPEAVTIHEDVRSKKSFGIHWGAFKLTNEYFMEPKTRLSQFVQDYNKYNVTKFVDFTTIDIGDTIEG